MGKVGLVCDSTCDLEPSWLAEHGVTMVPLKVLFGDETFLDWVDLRPEDFFAKLTTASALPKTSQPTPAQFGTAYGRLVDEGCQEIVSIHLTSKLSGTFESATIAAGECPVPVHVVDTGLVTQAAALVLKAAIDARDAGADAEEVARVATATASRTRIYFILDTLEYLVKGGRAGKAQGLAASLLDIKPILTFEDGIVVPFRKVKGRKKAMAELAAHVAGDTGGNPVRLAYFHSCAPERVSELSAALDAAGATFDLDGVGLVGAVIGTYAGPGAVGVAYHRTA